MPSYCGNDGLREILRQTKAQVCRNPWWISNTWNTRLAEKIRRTQQTQEFGIAQRTYCLISSIRKASIRSPIPKEAMLLWEPWGLDCAGQVNCPCAKVLQAKRLNGAYRAAPSLMGPRRATGKEALTSTERNYCLISSIRKASMMSPSLISWNFSKVIPHS